jgi:acetyl esterase/lipase
MDPSPNHPRLRRLVALLPVIAIAAACSTGSGGATGTQAAQAASTPSAAATAAPTAAASGASAAASLPAGSRPSGAMGGASAGGATPTYSGVAYASASPSETLDIYLPSGTTGPVPLVVLIHGGAFKMGDAAMEAGDAAAILAKGYAAASVNYRLSGEATFPAGVQDVKAAVRFLRANASKYGLDPDKFAVWGESAGGYLASMVGATGGQATIFDDASLGNAGVSSAVSAVVDWYGPTDFGQMDAEFTASSPAACNGQVQVHNDASSPESAWLGAALPSIPDTVKQASVLTYVATATKLPVYSIAHGDSDCQVPNQQSKILADAVTAKGGTATFTLVPGAAHGDPAITSAQTPVALAVLASVFGK